MRVGTLVRGPNPNFLIDLWFSSPMATPCNPPKLYDEISILTSSPTKNGGAIVGGDGRKFDIKVSGGLYYVYHVNVSTKPEKQVQKRALDVDEWHKIMGHCNVGDLISLENVVDGMKIKSKKRFHCETCVLGKMSVI